MGASKSKHKSLGQEPQFQAAYWAEHSGRQVVRPSKSEDAMLMVSHQELAYAAMMAKDADDDFMVGHEPTVGRLWAEAPKQMQATRGALGAKLQQVGAASKRRTIASNAKQRSTQTANGKQPIKQQLHLEQRQHQHQVQQQIQTRQKHKHRALANHVYTQNHLYKNHHHGESMMTYHAHHPMQGHANRSVQARLGGNPSLANGATESHGPLYASSCQDLHYLQQGYCAADDRVTAFGRQDMTGEALALWPQPAARHSELELERQPESILQSSANITAEQTAKSAAQPYDNYHGRAAYAMGLSGANVNMGANFRPNSPILTSMHTSPQLASGVVWSAPKKLQRSHRHQQQQSLHQQQLQQRYSSPFYYSTETDSTETSNHQHQLEAQQDEQENLLENYHHDPYLLQAREQANYRKSAIVRPQSQNQAQAQAFGHKPSSKTRNKARDSPESASKYRLAMSRFHEQGLSLTDDERKQRNLLGLLPAAYQDQEVQCRWVMNYIEHVVPVADELGKYVFLRNLKDFNERLFYACLSRNVEKLMPIVYTPVVGLACQRYSEIFMRPRGIYISIDDLGRVGTLLANWPEPDVKVIVVTDGERILGLGDLGANGMGICVGKLSLYTALAGVSPQNVLPVCLDVGTNNERLLAEPFYVGLRQPRAKGAAYDALVDEFMQAAVQRWGSSCLIQFEDFGNSNAFRLLQTYRDQYCTFNDDIQGTASVCLAGLIAATKQSDKQLKDCNFVFYGAGEANLGTANLIQMAMVEQGADRLEALERIWLVDSKGLVVDSRQDLSGHKRAFARKDCKTHLSNLIDIIELAKPTAIIGASAQANAFNEAVCRKMTSISSKPIIFALSNPTSKAECTAQQAYDWTDGKCIFASGSPFDPVKHNGKTYVTGQGNNAYIFPAVGLACIAAQMHSIPEESFLVAAKALAEQVTEADASMGLVYPKLNRIREVTLNVATKLLQYFYSERLATFRPEPSDKVSFLKAIQFDIRYQQADLASSLESQMSLASTATPNG